MLEFHEPTLTDLGEFTSPSTEFSPYVDPFSEADESILNWRDSVRARLEARREAKKNKQSGDRNLDDLPVIETSSSLPTDELLPVIEAIEAVSMDASGQSVGRDRDLPVIENNQNPTQQVIPEKSKGKHSGCIGTYRKGKAEYYRYSCRIEGKVKHRHIGEKRSEYAQHTVSLINRWILTGIPSRWILWNFFNGPDYPERYDDLGESYQKFKAYPYQPPSLPDAPPDAPKSPIVRLEEL